MACPSRERGGRRAGLDGARRRSCRPGRDGEKCRTASDPAENEAGRKVRVREAWVDPDVRPARASAGVGPVARLEGQAEVSAAPPRGIVDLSMVDPTVVSHRWVVGRPFGPADRRVARGAAGRRVGSVGVTRPGGRRPAAMDRGPVGVDRRAPGRRTAENRPVERSRPAAFDFQEPGDDPPAAAGRARRRGRRHAAHRANAGDRRKRAARRRNDPLMARPEEAARVAEGKVPRAGANRERRAGWAQARRRVRGAGRRALH